METRRVSIGAVPYDMSIIDGGVLFSNKSGFWGVSGRYMWAYNGLWYLGQAESTFGSVPGNHLIRMHKLLCEMIGKEHTKFELRFNDTINANRP